MSLTQQTPSWQSSYYTVNIFRDCAFEMFIPAALSCLSYHLWYQIGGRMAASWIHSCPERRRNLQARKLLCVFSWRFSSWMRLFWCICERVTLSSLQSHTRGVQFSFTLHNAGTQLRAPLLFSYQICPCQSPRRGIIGWGCGGVCVCGLFGLAFFFSC